MKFEPGVTTHVVVAPDKHDVGGVPLTDKVRSRPQVLLYVLPHGVCVSIVCAAWSAMQPAMNVCSICSMSLEPGVTLDVVVAPNKHDVGGVPLTDKVRHAVVYFAARRVCL
jgi:hypothetical protein